MFDDQLNNKQVPGNLPIGEPEDMLASTEGGTGDMPVSRPTALERGILKPKTEDIVAENPAGSQQQETPTMVTPPAEIYQVKEPALTRGIVTVIVVLVVLGILGGGGWWVYNSFIKTSLPNQQTTDTTATPNFVAQPLEEAEATIQVVEPEAATAPAQGVVGETTTSSGLENVAKEIADEQVLFGEPIDKDGDGLDDVKEAELSTDPNNWDTDGDALSDGDEVLIWKTNPLNPDTDGDTYKDGQEVKGGYNPNGPGKIFEVPEEKK